MSCQLSILKVGIKIQRSWERVKGLGTGSRNAFAAFDVNLLVSLAGRSL